MFAAHWRAVYVVHASPLRCSVSSTVALQCSTTVSFSPIGRKVVVATGMVCLALKFGGGAILVDADTNHSSLCSPAASPVMFCTSTGIFTKLLFFIPDRRVSGWLSILLQVLTGCFCELQRSPVIARVPVRGSMHFIIVALHLHCHPLTPDGLMVVLTAYTVTCNFTVL